MSVQAPPRTVTAEPPADPTDERWWDGPPRSATPAAGPTDYLWPDGQAQPVEVAPTAPRRARAFPWSKHVWREFGYLTVQLLLCSLALAYVMLTVSLGAGLLVTVVGLFAVGGLVLGARGWGAMYRGLDATLLGSQVTPPPAFVRPRGFWRTLGALLFDSTGWRALLYMVITFPLALVAWIVSITWLAVGVGGLTYWAWSWTLPYKNMNDGTQHQGLFIETDRWYWSTDRPGATAGLVVLGAVFLFLWAPLTHGFARLFALVGRALLGPTAGSIKVAELRRQRASIVTDADERLRRIERDLHDGTQARLVAIAMQLGEAREDLAAGATAQAGALVTEAHRSTKEALVELREIVRGIHPPALDAGLGIAIRTLAARSPVPVAVEIAPSVDATALAPAIASIAYYAVAELLTNVLKHSGATRATVFVGRETDERSHDWLRLGVADNGHGGARVVAGVTGVGGTGLAGIAERVASVDGRFGVTSPDGGPTNVDIALPVAVR